MGIHRNPVEPVLATLQPSVPIRVELNTTRSIVYFKLDTKAAQRILASIVISISDVSGGPIRLSVAENALPWWPPTLETQGDLFPSCKTEFGCNLFIAPSDFDGSTVYVAAVQISPENFQSMSIASFDVGFRQYRVKAEELPVGSDISMPSSIGPGEVQLFDINTEAIQSSGMVKLQLYAPLVNDTLLLQVLPFAADSRCLEPISQCEASLLSPVCHAEVLPCQLRESSEFGRRIRISLSWSPEWTESRLQYTLGIKVRSPKEIAPPLFYRHRVHLGTTSRFVVQPDSFSADSTMQITFVVHLGTVLVFQKYGAEAGDLQGCVSYDERYTLSASGEGNLTQTLVLTLSNCGALDPPPQRGIYFTVRSVDGDCEFSLSSQLFRHRGASVRSLQASEDFTDTVPPQAEHFLVLRKLGSVSQHSGLYFMVKSTAPDGAIHLHVTNTEEVECTHRNLPTLNCSITDGSCALYIPPCLVTNEKWMAVVSNNGTAHAQYVIRFEVEKSKPIRLVSGQIYSSSMHPSLPVHFEYGVALGDEQPTRLVATVYSSAAGNQTNSLSFYGLAPRSSDILAGPGGCFEHDVACVGVGVCALHVDGFALERGVYKFSATSHSQEKQQYTISIVELPASVRLEPGEAQHGDLLAKQSLYFHLDLTDSLRDPNATTTKFLNFCTPPSSSLCSS